ncbi:MAG: acetaldehyde dehydrogenase (acetylating) [Lachnospiraceae bacterium]|nr:acetaldehyde dehydrogenase (acetylating) [Lachnospiraceae bacterium]
MTLDRDLQSIQEVRDLVAKAKEAEKTLATFSQEQLDKICEAIAAACMEHAQELAKMAVEETGFGRVEDKVIKNQLGSKITWDYIKNMKVVGMLSKDPVSKVWEIGVPMGVVAALIPSTNPTSTVMYKSLISIKAGNTIIISPHPGAKNCITRTYQIIKEAAERAGAPEGTVNCISLTTVQATDTLLKHPDTSIILATGGEAMVHAAYSSGNPALGVGPGNGPSFIEKSADIPQAIHRIMASKTFDNGTICASEQSIVTTTDITGRVEEELVRQGAYFLTDEQSKQLSGFLLRANGTMNPKIVGRTAQQIADMAGIQIPQGTQLLVSRQDAQNVNKKNPYSREKLCPILAYFVVGTEEDACDLCIRILQNEGSGHTMTLHTQDEGVVTRFAMAKPVSRILVNTPGALGGVGATTGLAPALTLGCGAVGGSATSDNISPKNLINIRRVAYGLVELEDLKGRQQTACASAPAPASGSVYNGAFDNKPLYAGNPTYQVQGATPSHSQFDESDVAAITKAVLARLNGK